MMLDPNYTHLVKCEEQTQDAHDVCKDIDAKRTLPEFRGIRGKLPAPKGLMPLA